MSTSKIIQLRCTQTRIVNQSYEIIKDFDKCSIQTWIFTATEMKKKLDPFGSLKEELIRLEIEIIFTTLVSYTTAFIADNLSARVCYVLVV